MIKILLNIFLLAALILGCNNIEIKKNIIPQRIILNLTEQPTTEIAVTWMTNDSVINSQLEIAESKPWLNFIDSTKLFDANSEKVITDKNKNIFFHSRIVSNLRPDTKYIYRVGGDSIWSEWNQFKTADDNLSEFSFTYFGDVQHDVKEFSSRIFREAIQTLPQSEFWLFTGDLIDRAEFDYQWQEFFDAAQFIPAIKPIVLTAGNHEYVDTLINSEEIEFLADLWKVHITQPKSDIAGLDETVFTFVYQGARFIILNGNEKLNEQSKWLEQILNENKSKWTIISIHQPLYSMSKNRNQIKTRNAFLQVIDKYNVDLVLQGHDHVYARTYKLHNGKIVNENDKGTIYITSNSGTDSYFLESVNKNLAVKYENKLQLFQKITIDKNILNFKTYTANGELFDSFELIK
ncbi:MAG: metallophosphoesterase family protein [Ignavibacteriales bacterium]|nr:metallophosphoesterase family protein [Ignavibacteriales bacterium]